MESVSQWEVGPNSPSYGATDAEREKCLIWLAKERFLPFQRTVFYLEYKLAKLLICPLNDKYPMSRYAIRGYSRQSDSVALSSIPSHSSPARQPTGVRSHVLLRLPSQTRSTPACLGRCASFSGQIPIEFSLEFPGVWSLGQSPVGERLSRLRLQRLLTDSSVKTTKEKLRCGVTIAESVLSPVNLSSDALVPSPDQECTELHVDGSGKPISGGRKVLQFDLKEADKLEDGQKDPCLGFGSAALQQLKEDLLGTKVGMDSFREFLHGTLGIHLLDFWIDCEDFLEHSKRLEASATPQEIQLFFFNAVRNLQAKYNLSMPPASQEQLEETASDDETTFGALSRNQYEALRRLRFYWVPRFLIHYQRIRQLRIGPKSEFQMKDELLLPSDFLSSLNVVSSLPVKADPTDMMSEMKSNQNWRMVN